MYSIEEKHYPCSTSLTMRYIGGKWKAVILIRLLEKKRYSELKKGIPIITERALSLQLKELEEDGLIKRTVYTSKPPLKVDYELTEFGKTLVPLLKSIAEWGKEAADKNKNIKYIPNEGMDCSIQK